MCNERVGALPRLDNEKESKLKSHKFGIDLLKQAGIWENEFRAELEAGKPTVEVYTLFIERLKWLQHERLVHLLVFMTTVTALLFSVGAVIYIPEAATVWILVILLTVLTLAYMIHYFKLENLVQRWYLIEAEILSYIGRENEDGVMAGSPKFTKDV